MSNTPRTDAYLDTPFEDRECEWWDFARTLERELLQAHEMACRARLDADTAQAEVAALRAALEECVYFADNSQGIVGWHLNGDVLPWDQVEAIAQARAALAKEDVR